MARSQLLCSTNEKVTGGLGINMVADDDRLLRSAVGVASLVDDIIT